MATLVKAWMSRDGKLFHCEEEANKQDNIVAYKEIEHLFSKAKSGYISVQTACDRLFKDYHIVVKTNEHLGPK